MDFELLDELQTLRLLGRVAGAIQLPEFGSHFRFREYTLFGPWFDAFESIC
jgi:hypothetical protein